MPFHSILFENADAGTKRETPSAPGFFPDLNLDQVVDAVTAGREEYNLKPFFYAPLNDTGAIAYRQEIMRDLEDDNLLKNIKTFAGSMQVMRRQLALAEKLEYKYHKEGWFLETVAVYCEAVNRLARDLALADLKSRGLLSFRGYLAAYAGSREFASLLAGTKQLKSELSAVKYSLLIQANHVTVREYAGEADYSAEVEKTFAKFKQGAVKDYRREYAPGPEMNRVEAGILDLVAGLRPRLFPALGRYCAKNRGYLDGKTDVFDREIQFYLAWLEYSAAFKRAGLKLCYPRLSAESKEVRADEVYDPALARKLIAAGSPVITNDFCLKGKERIFVVTGPNQGGKTTFARAFGQLHYLAALGCPVPGREARLFLFDRLFTHFEKEEDIANLRGKLHDDLVRMREILALATPRSIIIMNEIFTSTTVKDAVYLGGKLA